jgi:hypothetical protein
MSVVSFDRLLLKEKFQFFITDFMSLAQKLLRGNNKKGTKLAIKSGVDSDRD